MTAAERMRRSRKRRRAGQRCVPFVICDHEIEALVKNGWLDPVARNDRRAIGREDVLTLVQVAVARRAEDVFRPTEIVFARHREHGTFGGRLRGGGHTCGSGSGGEDGSGWGRWHELRRWERRPRLYRRSAPRRPATTLWSRGVMPWTTRSRRFARSARRCLHAARHVRVCPRRGGA